MTKILLIFQRMFLIGVLWRAIDTSIVIFDNIKSLTMHIFSRLPIVVLIVFFLGANGTFVTAQTNAPPVIGNEIGNVARRVHSYPLFSYYVDAARPDDRVLELDLLTMISLPIALIHPALSPRDVSLPAYLNPLFLSFSSLALADDVQNQQVYLFGGGSRIPILEMAGPLRLAPFLAIGPVFLGGHYFTVYEFDEPRLGQEYETFFLGPFAVGSTVFEGIPEGYTSAAIDVVGILSRFDLLLPIHLGGFISGNPGSSWIKVLPRLTLDMAQSDPFSFQIGFEFRPSFGHRRATELEPIAGEAQE